MMEARFEDAFVRALKKHSAIKKEVERKVRSIMAHPVELGEPLKGNFRGFYSSPVKRNYLIIYLYCAACRKKGDAVFVLCSDCNETQDETLKFVFLGPHDAAYNMKP
jgi:mRNA-degrading endonuclease YafQ of YafQ-DinJ toxin-antitoxin module